MKKNFNETIKFYWSQTYFKICMGVLLFLATLAPVLTKVMDKAILAHPEAFSKIGFDASRYENTGYEWGAHIIFGCLFISFLIISWIKRGNKFEK